MRQKNRTTLVNVLKGYNSIASEIALYSLAVY